MRKLPTCKNCGGRHYTYQCWSKPKKKAVSKPLRSPTRAVKRQSGGSNRQKLIRELDRVTSLYVRSKDADRFGFNYCYTCGGKYQWKLMDCGHYIKRRYLHTRWDLDNVHVQCQVCNRNLGGNYGVYERKMKAQYGADGVLKLWDKAYRKDKIPTVTLEIMLAEMKQKLKSLKK